jgi:hypothetical protein
MAIVRPLRCPWQEHRLCTHGREVSRTARLETSRPHFQTSKSGGAKGKRKVKIILELVPKWEASSAAARVRPVSGCTGCLSEGKLKFMQLHVDAAAAEGHTFGLKAEPLLDGGIAA